MRMRVTAHGFDLTDDLRTVVHHQTERLAQGVDRLINHVTVELFDETCPGVPGPHKRCEVGVEFDDGLTVIGGDVEDDFPGSVSAAFDKVICVGFHPRL
jgi:ribosome-associated translation inhibitor RaiA